MHRSRFLQGAMMIAGLALVLYLLVSLFLPSSRRLIFGVGKRDGRVRLVQQTVTFLPPHEYYRLSFEKRDGYAQRDGLIRITSKEGVPVTITYRLRFGVEGSRIPDSERLVSEGWNAWIRARVSEAVSAVTTQVPIEELIAPTSVFNTQRDPLRQTVARHLAQSGLKVTAFEIARVDIDREALLRAKRAELRRDARGVAGRVAIFAVEGADWELLSELGDDGRIPNIRALVKGGTTASVQTIQPTVSPLLWTTVSTGLPPDRHGVLDFVDHGRNVPVDGYSRHVPAVWEIAEAFGRHSMVTNWWTAWPPRSTSTVCIDTPVQFLPSAISPASLAPRAQSVQVTAASIGYDQIHRFLNITPAEYQKSVESGNPADPILQFRGVLAKTWSDHRAAINLYRDQAPLLFMMDYEGTDAVNHLFAPFHPPYRQDISEESYRKYWPAVANYYAEVDRMIGEWMSILPEDTTVMIVSAHGYRWGKNRARSQPHGAALSDHRNPGVFIGYGNHIVPSRSNHSMSIYDVTPTALAILGLPKSAEMPGGFMAWAFKDVVPVTSVRVVSYSEFAGERPIPQPERPDAKSYLVALQSMGHLTDPSRAGEPVLEEDQPPKESQPLTPEKWSAYAYYNNLGVDLRKQGKPKDAAEAFQKAIDLNPTRPIPYLNLAMLLVDRQQYTAAEENFLEAIAKGLPNGDHWFADFAGLYRDKNLVSRAVVILYKGKSMFPQSYLIEANLGAALLSANRFTEGLPELERALGLQPSSTQVLNNLGIFYAKKNDYARALDFWNRSLAIDPRQPPIRLATDAARTRL